MPDGTQPAQTAAPALYRIDVSGMRPAPRPTDAAPDVQLIPIDALRIDPAYQRPITRQGRKAIQSMADRWRWRFCGAIEVAPLPGGLYAVIDGQHRTHAALLAGIDTMPCLVVPVPQQDQAAAFIAMNSTAIKVSPHHILRAAIHAGEPWALQCDSAVSAAGCRLMTYLASGNNRKARQIYAVTLVRQLVDRHGPAPLTAALGALVDYDTQGRVALWDGYILTPWLTAATQSGIEDRAPLLRALQTRDPFHVLKSAEQEAERTRQPRATLARALFAAMIEGAR